MSKIKINGPSKAERMVTARRMIAVGIALLMAAVVVTGALAQSKEYIYAGGKVVATEEPTSGGPTTPPAPTGLTATPGNAQVSLSWSASSGATSYNVKRSTTNGGPYSNVATGVTATSYTNTGLTNGTTYYYVVTASNTAGTSGNSNQASATPTAGGGSQTIFDGSCGLVRPGDISLGCDPFDETPGLKFNQTFNVSYASGDTVRVRMFNIDDTEYVYVNGVLRGQAGYGQDVTVDLHPFMVAGSNTIQLVLQNGDYNPWCYGFTLTKTAGSGGSAPSAPTGLTATAGNAQASLSWSASSGATSYTVKRSTTNGGPYSNVATGVTATSYTNTGLTNGTTYYYVVTAVNSFGESSNSNQASATPTSPPTPPPAPTGLTATPGNAQASLSWSASSGATSYTVKRSTTNGGPYSNVATGVTATSYTNTGLTNGTTYYYVVTASNTAGTSGNSNQASATPTAGGGSQTIFDGSCGLVIPGNVSQGCNPASEYPGRLFDQTFNVSYASGDTVQVRMFNIDDHEYVFVNGVLRAQAHYGQDVTVNLSSFMVVGTNTVQLALDNDGYTPWCYGFTLTKTAGSGGSAPSAPTGLTATPGNAQVSLSWSASSGATSYNVKRSTTNGGPYSNVATGVTATSYTNTGLTNGTTYYYVVTAVNSFGESSNSNQASATPNNASGLCTSVSHFSGDGTYAYLEGPAASARWAYPHSGVVAKDPVSGLNALFVTDTDNHRIRMVYLEGANTGQSILIAGSGVAGYWEGDGDPFQTMYNWPLGITAVTDSNGVATELLIADTYNHRIRKLLRPLSGSSWRPEWLSGQGTAGFSDGPAASSLFNYPRGVLSFDGSIYVADTTNTKIRKLDQQGNSSTLTSGFSEPTGITVSPLSGYLYITEFGGHNIWRVTTTGAVTKIAGASASGFADGTGTAAKFAKPHHLVWSNTSSGEALFITDRNNNRIRKLMLATNAVTTHAGVSVAGYVDGSCSSARFNQPRGIAISASGELYILDTLNNRIRKIQ